MKVFSMHGRLEELKMKNDGKIDFDNMAFELQKAKKDLINSVLDFIDSHKNLKDIEDPDTEDIFKESDRWSDLFYNMMRYFEVKSAMSKRSDVEIMMEALKKKLELEND